MRRTIAVVASAAILVTGASGGAVAARLIGSAQIADDSVQSVDLKDGDVAAADLRPGLRSTIAGALTGYTVRENRWTLSGDWLDPGRDFLTLRSECPDGKVALGGGEAVGGAFDVLASIPMFDETTNRASGWMWRLRPNFAPDHEEDVWLYVTCANG